MKSLNQSLSAFSNNSDSRKSMKILVLKFELVDVQKKDSKNQQYSNLKFNLNTCRKVKIASVTVEFSVSKIWAITILVCFRGGFTGKFPV